MLFRLSKFSTSKLIRVQKPANVCQLCTIAFKHLTGVNRPIMSIPRPKEPLQRRNTDTSLRVSPDYIRYKKIGEIGINNKGSNKDLTCL